MPQYRSAGRIPPKRHTQMYEANELAFEEMHTLHGFSDIYSLLYHRSAPTEVLEILPAQSIGAAPWPEAGHRHHLLNSLGMTGGGTFLENRRPLLQNQDIVISTASPDRSDKDFYRNGLCDELICVDSGAGELCTPYGTLTYGSGDMIVVPRGTTQFWRLSEGVVHRFLVVESKTTITPPARYLSRLGQFSFHSPICERDVRGPELSVARSERGRFKIRVKMGEELTDYVYATHPFDVIGWDGYVGSVAKIVKLEHAWRRLDGRNDDGFQVAPFPG